MSHPQAPVYAVILAGGSGTRFWPASRKLRPKQLLPLGPSAPLSLLRSTLQRLDGLVATEHRLISTGRHLLPGLSAELPELPAEAFLAEPCAKNTAPCIAWAAAWVAAREPEAVLAVLPSDQHALDATGFQATLAQAVAVARQGHITTIGIRPTRPETGYGYIELGASSGPMGHEVARFVEKPQLAVAQTYVESGRYLWNAGMFVFRACDMLAAVARHLPEMSEPLARIGAASLQGAAQHERAVEDFFASCPKVSIDYGIMEKESGLRVVPGDFGWSDLGSWESAWELSPKDERGNAAPAHAVLVDAERNLVSDLRSLSGSSKKRICLLGVEDLVVVETDDALLVMPRGRSQDVREIVAALEARGDSELL